MPKVMIAEDDFMMADMLADVLIGDGYEVCGTAGTVEEAVELNKRHKPDLAILDVRLAAGGLGTDVAARLARGDRPGILYATGNTGQINLTKADGEACLGKPYRPEDVLHALKLVEQLVATGKASRPFPQGFYVLEQPPTKDSDASNEISRLRRQQTALARFGHFALKELDLAVVLTEAARVCAEGLDVPFCKICRYRKEEDDLLVEAGVGWHQGVIGHVISRADESSPQGRAFITGKPVICRNLQEDGSFLLPALYAEHGIISTVDVVIAKEGQPYGILEIDSPVQQDYDHHDIDFLTGFANVLAEAVETSNRNIALRNALVRMADMVADRDRLLVAQNALLAEKNRLLEEKNVMAQELQHRVRNNLHLVHGMVAKQIQSSTDENAKEGLSAIARRVITLARVYDHLLGVGLSRTIDFSTYLTSLCSSLEVLQAADRPEIKLFCHTEPVILDLDHVTALGLVVSELMSNSYKYAFPGGKGTINVSLKKDSEAGDAASALLIFADDGVGFHEAGESRRHGLGLVKRLMEQVHGTATLCLNHGAEWTLRFPVPLSADREFGQENPANT